MEFTTKEFIPVLFGNDINVYSVARAFYEKYGVKSKVFGKALMGTCYKSKLVDFTEVKNLDSNEVITETINDFAMKNTTKKILAIGCGDNYVKC
ncbi:MAG: ATP-grasp domain-containing protein, partial [Clostridia bacterium]|nr:ATP-grasp domain-containing protein [Clostridia bacterium]